MAKTKKYPGSIERRGDSFRIRLCVDGKRVYFTPDVRTKVEAENFAREKHAELLEQAERRREGLPGPMRLSVLFDRFEEKKLPPLAENTRKTYADSLAAFRTYFTGRRDLEVGKVRQAHVIDFMDWRRTHRPDGSAAETSARTVAKDRAVLSAVFSYAQELELRDGNPVKNVKAPKHDAREAVILSGEEFDRLLAQCEDPMLRTYVLTLVETGGRCDSEVLWLRWTDLDLEEGFIKIESSKAKGRRTKSGKSRYVPMTLRLRRALTEHARQFRNSTYRGEASPWVFHHTRTRRHATAGQRIGSLRQGFKAAAKRAGLPEELHQHDLRHTRVVNWLSEGKPIHIVRDAMGHSTVKVTEGYDQYVKERLRQLVDQEPPTIQGGRQRISIA